LRRKRIWALSVAFLAAILTTVVMQSPAQANTGGCSASNWTGHGFNIGVCIDDRATTTTAYPDIYVNASPYSNTAPTAACSILIEVWDGNANNYTHDQVGCAAGHYNGYATPVFGSVQLHSFARLILNGVAYGTQNSPVATLGTHGTVLYDYDFVVSARIGSVGLAISGHAADAFAELHRCFNCSFPIGNAPAAYPADNQYVALDACPLFSICNAPVRFFSAPQNDYLMIVAQPGHFDAPGSTLRWRFYTDSAGYLHLDAKTWNLGTTMNVQLNQAGAYVAWGQYASRLGLNLYSRCGGTHCS
jgi:hypothetical protein